MGDIADQMLSGDLCESCGDYLGDGNGFPQQCADCDAETLPSKKPIATKRKVFLINCPECGKKVKVVGLQDHIRDIH